MGWLLVAALVAVSVGTVPSDLPETTHADKVAHLLAYMLVMGWFAQIWSSRSALFVHACFLVVLGIGLEMLQGSTDHRTADPLDALANAAGVVLGWLAARTPASRRLERLEASIWSPR